MALILVLWLATLLTVMAATLALDSRREAQLLRGALDRARGTALCEGALHYAMGRLLHSNARLKWRADGTVYELLYGGARVRVRMLDEAAKVDLNTAREGWLQGLLLAAGASQDEAVHMADVIMDWRDGDAQKRFQGAEAEDYRLAGRNFGPRNKPFQTVEELQTVLGMTATLYQRLEPWITVHSRQAGIDPHTAPAELLRRLPGISAIEVENYLQARSELAAEAPLPPGQVRTQAPALPPLQAPANMPFGRGAQRAVGTTIEALLDSGERIAVSAVASRGGSRRPLSIVRWREQAGAGVSLFNLPVAERVAPDLPLQ
jgi:general secretion pathway protein K